MQSKPILDRAQLLLSQGRAAAVEQKWSEAEAKLTEALQLGGQLDPGETDVPVMAMLALAQLSYDRGEAGEAVHRATTAFALSAESNDAGGWQLPLYELMASLFEEMGAPQRSVAFRHALVGMWRGLEGGGSANAKRNCVRLAASLKRLGLYQQAAGAYQEAAALEHAADWAEALSLSGQHEEAHRMYQRAHSSGQPAADILTRMGRMFIAWGRLTQALHCFEEAAKLEPGAKAGWADALLLSGETNRAREMAESAVSQWRADGSEELAGGLETLSRAGARQGDLESAEAHCREAIQLMDQRRIPDLTARERRLRWHAELLERLGRAADAARAIQQAGQAAAIRSQVPKLFPSNGNAA